MTTVSVSTNAEMMSALASAVGGDRIELAPGGYEAASLKNMAFSSDVTIVSADPADPAVFRDLYVRDTSHLVIDGILFDYTFEAPWSPATNGEPIAYLPFEIRESSYITIRNSVFDGDTGRDYDYGWGVGLSANQGCDNILVENNEFFNFYKAFAGGQSSNFVLRGNNVHGINTDGFTFVSVDGILIEGNHFHDWFSDPAGHRDMVQIWTKINQTSSQNVTIRGNFFDAGIGEQTQTIFLRNNIVDTNSGSFEDYAFRNFLIEDNVIYNANGHGITVGETDGLVVRNNTILFDEFAHGDHNFLAPQMRLQQGSVNVTVESNISHWEVQFAPGWTVEHELVVETSDYADLFVNALVSAPTLADLRALPGGTVEFGSYGAAMTRADLPMSVGPYGIASSPDPDPVPEPGVCEALLAEALAVVADLEAQLVVSQTALVGMTALWSEVVAAKGVVEFERDAALALQAMAETERDNALTALTDAEAALAEMTVLWGEMVDALVVTETALAEMTTERDAALAAQAVALTDLAVAQTQLVTEMGKLDAIRVIVGG